MKKKGFTLVELLAVIVILAIIALIAIPLIGNVIEKAKIGALENSVNGLVESANMYYANQSIKGDQAVETIFDFANGEQTSTSKLEYKGKVYNGKLILHANGEVAVCIDDKEHYAYKNKDNDEIVSGIGTCVYDGTTGDFSSNSFINDLRGKTVVATNITQSADGLSTLITIPEEGHYDTNSRISVANSDLGSNAILLWNNLNPTSNFSKQSIFLDLSEYEYILIEMYVSITAQYVGSRLLINKNEQTVEVGGGYTTISNTLSRTRNISANNTSISFDDCRENGILNNAYLIPYKIYGFKKLI